MRRIFLIVGLVTFAACAPKEEPAPDTVAAAPAIAPLMLGDVAGVWSARVMPLTSDSVVITYDLIASADPTAWTLTLPGRPTIAVRPVADGDSIMTEAGPYESALRKGQQVTTRGVFRLVNGKLVGTTTAHYQTSSADSVATYRVVATKKM